MMTYAENINFTSYSSHRNVRKFLCFRCIKICVFHVIRVSKRKNKKVTRKCSKSCIFLEINYSKNTDFHMRFVRRPSTSDLTPIQRSVDLDRLSGPWVLVSSFKNSDRFSRPWISAFPFKNSDRFDVSWIPASPSTKTLLCPGMTHNVTL